MKRWNIKCTACGEQEIFSDDKPVICPKVREGNGGKSHKVSPLSYVREWTSFRRENRRNDGYMVELDNHGKVLAETDGKVYRYNIPVEMPKVMKEVLLSCAMEGRYFGVSVPSEYVPDTGVKLSMKCSTQEKDISVSYSLYWINMGEALNGNDVGNVTILASHGVMNRVMLADVDGTGKTPCGYIGGNVEESDGTGGDDSDLTIFTIEASFQCLM